MRVEQKNIYRCSCCNDSFEDEAECKEHEIVCGKHVDVKTICMRKDLVSGNPYFYITVDKWPMERYLTIKQSVDTILHNSCGSTEETCRIYTTDLSKETENKFKLELLNHKRTILEGRLKRASESITYIDKEIKKIIRKTNAGKKDEK